MAEVVMVFPRGDRQGILVTAYQPVTLAAMEGLFESKEGAPIALVGQPDMDQMKLDNPILVPKVLSFLTYRRWSAGVKGLKDFPADLWPDNVPLLYYTYHIMVGLGTLFLVATALAAGLLARGRLYGNRAVLWVLMLTAPLPYIATTAGWITAEVGRQPRLVYGVMPTAAGASPRVSAGNGLFTLIGFMGLYLILGLVFLVLVSNE